MLKGYVKEINFKTVMVMMAMAAVMLLAAMAVSLQSASADDSVEEPKDFKAEKVGLYNKAKVSWSKAKGADGYQIYRSTKKFGKYKKVKQTGKDSESYVNKKLKKRAVYYYKMRAVSDNGKEHSSFTKPEKVVVKYKIAQVSDVTVEQLVRYFKKSGHKFPRYYKKTDTPTLKKFCQAYIDECADEGIDAKVAFVQSMLETGWLKFGGSVSIRQNNFAGLGAVGGGVKGNSFKTVKKGIRAQIQHLKAYATNKPLNKKCVDKRYKYVNRGCAPYVEWLGIGDNPTGNGWCAGSGYGYTIVKMIHKI